MKKLIRRIIASLLVLAMVLSVVFMGGEYLKKNIFYPVKYQEYVEIYSSEYSVDKALIYAVINCESGFDPEAVSAAGALGLMQITPETFRWLQTKDDTDETLADAVLYDPETNIKYGVLLLSLNIQEFGNVHTALASYNAGRGKVAEWLADERYSTDSRTLISIPYPETANYVKKVEKKYKTYREILEN